jgi:hypothetical protein
MLGAVIAYARPFTDSVRLTFRQQPEQRKCFMGIAADLGANTAMHAAILLARDQLIALSDPWGAANSRASEAHPSLRRFVYPNPGCARIVARLDLCDFDRIAVLMRLACVFFLAEVTPAPRF